MSIEQQIRRAARRHGIDPNAAVAVARTEGGLSRGAVGDHGTSYGPFQLHVGGALPRGRSAAWANSPQGIDYALSRMAQAGAQGLTGRAAVSAIVRNFERPAAPGQEISRALGYYGGRSTPVVAPSGGLDTGGAVSGGPAPSFLQALIRGDTPKIISGLHAARPSAPAGTSALPTGTPPSGVRGPAAAGADIRELFYDPIGAIKNGQSIAPVGGHGDHVHFSAANAREMLAAIRKAQGLGLHVGENPYVGRVAPVHVENSYHYRTYQGRYGGRKLGEAIDVSGDPRKMAQFYHWVSRHL